MAINDIVSLVSTVGFPIVACLGLGWYVKYTTDQNNAEVKEMRVEYQTQIDKVTEALNNNTLALQRLCDKFDNNIN